MQIKIEIDDEELQKEVTRIIANKLTATWSMERNLLKTTVANAVKDVVYSQKADIIKMVVNRASAEIVRKAMPELLNKMMSSDSDKQVYKDYRRSKQWLLNGNNKNHIWVSLYEECIADVFEESELELIDESEVFDYENLQTLSSERVFR